jgi:hypothetical protein
VFGCYSGHLDEFAVLRGPKPDVLPEEIGEMAGEAGRQGDLAEEDG